MVVDVCDCWLDVCGCLLVTYILITLVYLLGVLIYLSILPLMIPMYLVLVCLDISAYEPILIDFSMATR